MPKRRRYPIYTDENEKQISWNSIATSDAEVNESIKRFAVIKIDSMDGDPNISFINN